MSPRTALITGGASGFGAEVARQLVRRGDQVVLVDVDAEAGGALAEELGAHFLRCDVSDLDQVQETTAEAESIHGGLDIFFLNAGISTGCGVDADFDPVKYRRAMSINVDGVVYGAHAALPVLRRRGGGSIVCTASMAGLTSVPFDPVYGANKHAVVGLVRGLGPALAPEGIRVNAFCPGFAETKIITDIKVHLQGMGVPIIPVADAGAAIVKIMDSSASGECWLMQAGHEATPYLFRGIPAPKSAEGERLAGADASKIGTDAPH